MALAKQSGLLMKHTNYTIFSKRKNTQVTRRYSDFEPLDAYLRKMFPYRIIPTCVSGRRQTRKPETNCDFLVDCHPRVWTTRIPSFSRSGDGASSVTSRFSAAILV